MGKKGKKTIFKPFNDSIISGDPGTVRNTPNYDLSTSGTTQPNLWNVDTSTKCEKSGSNVLPGRQRRNDKTPSKSSRKDEIYSADEYSSRRNQVLSNASEKDEICRTANCSGTTTTQRRDGQTPFNSNQGNESWKTDDDSSNTTTQTTYDGRPFSEGQGDDSPCTGNHSGETVIQPDLVESLDNMTIARNIGNQNATAGIVKEHSPNRDREDWGTTHTDDNMKYESISRPSIPHGPSNRYNLRTQDDKYCKSNMRNTNSRHSKFKGDSSQFNVTSRKTWQKEDKLKPEDSSENFYDSNRWPETKGTKLNVNAESFQPPDVKYAMPEWPRGNLAESSTARDERGDFYNTRPNRQSQRRGYSTGEVGNNKSYGNQNTRRSDSDWNQFSKRFSEGREDTNFEQNKSHYSRNSRISRQSDLFDRSSENVDSEYKEFEEQERKKLKVEFIRVKEIDGDLFTMPEEYSLAHCVAEDMRMGSGIAVNFRRDFKDLDCLLNQRQKQGGLAILELQIKGGGIRYIYYLVTKRDSTGKPTYEKFWSSLKKMRDHIDKHEVNKLAIPKLGCGLDRLEWTRVKHMIEFLFKDIDVEIVVCNFQQSEDAVEKPLQIYTSSKVVHVKKPIAEIESETAIIYFSTEDAHVSTEMQQLGKKFAFRPHFDREPKSLGHLIPYQCPKIQGFYKLYGCIVRKTNKDPLDFVSLCNCVKQINRNNKKEKYYYVAYQAIEDDDDLINEKIITILRNYITKSEIYVCWDGDLAQKMPVSNRDTSFN